MSDLPVTVFDLGVLAIVGLSALLAINRGFVREVFGLLSWVGAFVVAFQFFGVVRPMVLEAAGHDLIADAGAIVIVFVVPLIAFKLITRLIANAVDGGVLGFSNRFLGFGFGLVRGGVIVAALYLVGSVVVERDNHPDWVKDAMTLPPVAQAADWLAVLLPPDLMERSREVVEETSSQAQTTREEMVEGGYGESARNAVDNLIGRGSQ